MTSVGAERLLQDADDLRLRQCGLRIADCGLRDCGLVDCGLRTAHALRLRPATPPAAAATVSVYSHARRVAGDERQQLVEHRARVADERQRGLLEGVELGDVDPDEPHLLVLERGLRRGREVAQPRADDDARDRRRARGDSPPAYRWRRRRRAKADAGRAARPFRPASRPPGCRSRPRTAAARRSPRCRCTPPPATISGRRLCANQPRRLQQPIAIRPRPRDRPDARLEQRRRDSRTPRPARPAAAPASRRRFRPATSARASLPAAR